jgi:alpha 1,2-mannosyltransferase
MFPRTLKPSFKKAAVIAIILLIIFLPNSLNVFSKDFTVSGNDSLKEMLSKELDYSLDQVAYFQENYDKGKVNAVLLGLVRNSELDQMMHSVKELERSFNSKFQYPYLFLNDVEFSQEFKIKISSLTNATVEFGLIPKAHWSIPNWIDESKFRRQLNWMSATGVPYGGLESYRHMCRFNSGFFYKHELIQKYDYYWRVINFGD